LRAGRESARAAPPERRAGCPARAWLPVRLYAEIEPSLTGGAYINFLSSEGEDRVQAAYGTEKFARLRALKDRYDPTNLFHLNQNIPPS
jgi:Berberine and berberine like